MVFNYYRIWGKINLGIYIFLESLYFLNKKLSSKDDLLDRV